jgi:hypothetical protein
MFQTTQLMTTALEIFISRNETLQWELANFHIHPGGLFIRQRKDDHAKAAFARAAEERRTTPQDYALMLVARSPSELERLREERRREMAA